MHLRFPKKRDFWSWRELICLARTLGFTKDLFKRNVPKEKEGSFKDGLKIQDIMELIDSKSLNGDLHRTFNLHDAAYNTKVIQKSIELLSNRFLTFQDIKDARMAFQLYEHMDNAGLSINEHTMARCLKLCGRAISQIKLTQHLKHMDRLVQDRLMFYEFLDILLLCEKVKGDKSPSTIVKQENPNVKDDRNLYQLQDFRNMLLTEDEKISEDLNEAYKKDLESTPLRKSAKNDEILEEKPWRVTPIVDHKVREEMVVINKQHKSILDDQLDLSNQEVLEGRTFPSCNCNKQSLPQQLEIKADGIGFQESIDADYGVPSASLAPQNVPKKMIYKREPLVSNKELAETKIQIDDLQWNIATQGEQMRKKREMTAKRQRHIKNVQFVETAKEAEEKLAAVGEKSNFASRQSHTSNEFRTRLKDLSRREKIDQETKDERRQNQDSATERKICLEERLQQIDILMERVCQR